MNNFELIINGSLSKEEIMESYKYISIEIMKKFCKDIELSNFDICDIERNILHWLNSEIIIEKL